MNQASVHIVDYLIIGVSLLIPISISLFFSRKQSSTNRFFTAGGSIPAWAIGMSILATLISSITFLAYPGEGFASNWILLVQGLMVPIVLLFFIGFVVPLYRKVIKLSAYEYFEQRFGFGARLYGSLGFILAHFAGVGTVFFLIALTFSRATGLDTTDMVWVMGSLIIFITLIGGIEAVIWLDVIQGFILIAGGLVTLAILLMTTEGGPAAIWEVALEHNRVGFGPYDLEVTQLTFLVMVLNGAFYAIQKYGTDQTIVQRYLTARSDKEAIRASLMGVLMSVPVWAMFMFIGTALFAYYRLNGVTLPTDVKPDEVFPYFMMTQMPVGVVGLLLSALLAAAISSLDSELNCLSAVCLEDYYVRFNPQSTEKQRMFFSKLAIILGGILSIFIALYYVRNGGEGALGIVFTLYAIFSGGIAGMFLLGIFCPRANKPGVYIGILASILFTAYAVITSTTFEIRGENRLLVDLGAYNFTHHTLMIGVYSHAVLFGVGYLASLVFPPTKNTADLTYVGWLKQRNPQEEKSLPKSERQETLI